MIGLCEHPRLRYCVLMTHALRTALLSATTLLVFILLRDWQDRQEDHRQHLLPVVVIAELPVVALDEATDEPADVPKK